MKNRRRSLGLLALLIVLGGIGWYRFAPGETPPGQAPLVTLEADSLHALREDFNRDANQTRVIVLLSPT